jgi:hypothetical protein
VASTKPAVYRGGSPTPGTPLPRNESGGRAKRVHSCRGMMAGMARDPVDVWIELHVALGLVVTSGARMEETLRDCFCMLADADRADVVAAGQDISWLIEYCGDLAEANPGMAQASKDAIKIALTSCRVANQRRNELIHGVHTFFDRDFQEAGWGFVP